MNIQILINELKSFEKTPQFFIGRVLKKENKEYIVKTGNKKVKCFAPFQVYTGDIVMVNRETYQIIKILGKDFKTYTIL